MKEGDIITAFGNPVKCTHPIGQAKLIKKISEHSNLLENWWIEYLNNPGRQYTCLIRKPNGESKTQ